MPVLLTRSGLPKIAPSVVPVGIAFMHALCLVKRRQDSRTSVRTRCERVVERIRRAEGALFLKICSIVDEVDEISRMG